MAGLRPLYRTDLAYIHDRGFSDLAAGVAPELLRILRRHGLRRARIVEAGCGSGVLAKHLTDAGHHVLGLAADDPAGAAARAARAVSRRVADHRAGSAMRRGDRGRRSDHVPAVAPRR